jgi:hypothetical protein
MVGFACSGIAAFRKMNHANNLVPGLAIGSPIIKRVEPDHPMLSLFPLIYYEDRLASR